MAVHELGSHVVLSAPPRFLSSVFLVKELRSEEGQHIFGGEGGGVTVSTEERSPQANRALTKAFPLQDKMVACTMELPLEADRVACSPELSPEDKRVMFVPG